MKMEANNAASVGGTFFPASGFSHSIYRAVPKGTLFRSVLGVRSSLPPLRTPPQLQGRFSWAMPLNKIVVAALLGMIKFFLALIAIAVAALIGAFVFAAFTL